MEWGRNLEHLQAMDRAGKDVPALRRLPRHDGLEWLWEAFVALGTCRQIGMVEGPIPWTAVRTYAEATRSTPWETVMLHEVIAHLDNVRFKLLEKRRK